MSIRGVLNRGMAVVFAAVCLWAWGIRSAEPTYPYATLAAAFNAGGFDPALPGAACLVACTDLHIGAPQTTTMPSYLIDEINAMEPAPAYLVFTGDMICSASPSFGDRPDAAGKAKATAEFEILKRDLQRLRPETRVRLCPGNHDTYPGEDDAALLRTVFPDAKPYAEEELAGVALFFLNGGASGDLDARQSEWLATAAAALAPTCTAMLCVHQPGLGGVVAERGISTALSRAFDRHEGPLWLLAGHGHSNGDDVFRIGKTTIVQARMTTCNPNTWGDAEKGGYWVYGLRDGAVRCRVFRRPAQGYRLGLLPDRAQARALPVPFGNLEGVLWSVFVGDGDRAYLVSAKAADVVSWWGYLTEVVYRLPLTGPATRPARLAVLASLDHANPDAAKRGAVALSDDGTTWHNATLAAPLGGCYLIDIPADLAAGKVLWVRVSGPGYHGGALLGGFALCAGAAP
jgi:hypothetical protein